MILEIRTYRLKPGSGEGFLQLMRNEALPLLESSGIRVVRCGLSLVAEDGHDEAFLLRAFRSLDERREQEEAFYGSDAWRHGPREAILSMIESYHSVVIETSEAAVRALEEE